MAPRTSPEPVAPQTPPVNPALTVGTQLDAEPAKGKPVVLSTGLLDEFVLAAPLDDKGEPKGSDIRVTSSGVALSKTDAKRVTEAAVAAGVTLTEKDNS